MRRLGWSNTESHVLVAGPYRLDRAHPESLRTVFMDSAKIGTADHKGDFFRAKHNGNAEAALKVVQKTLDILFLRKVEAMLNSIGSNDPILIAPYRQNSRNVLALIAAKFLAEKLNLEFDTDIIQLPGKSRKQLNKLEKLFEFPSYAGDVKAGRHYIVIDDMLGLGSTIAELRSYILKHGGVYDFACCLASPSGQDHIINADPVQEEEIRKALGGVLAHHFEEVSSIYLSSLTRKESYLLAGETSQKKLAQMMSVA